MDEDRGWLENAERVPSPNWDQRPADTPIDLLVIHNISLPPGEFGGPWIDALFQNRLDPAAHPSFASISDLKVSAHLLVRRDGRLIQYVPLHLRAWHAGRSSFHGRENCNDFSIGIELEGSDNLPFDEVQYAVLERISRHIMQVYPAIDPGRITGHRDIAPGRKSDPGPLFDWKRYLGSLSE